MQTIFIGEDIQRLSVSINSQIPFDYLHFKYENYSFIDCFNLSNNIFQKLYQELINKHIKNKIDSYRIVYSLLPSIVCYLPKNYLYHSISHPLTSQSYSIFCPFTKWLSSNTIYVEDETGQLPILDQTNIYLINDIDRLIFPTHMNTSNNTGFGIFFTVMSFSNYKNSVLSEYQKIGHVFGLL